MGGRAAYNGVHATLLVACPDCVSQMASLAQTDRYGSLLRCDLLSGGGRAGYVAVGRCTLFAYDAADDRCRHNALLAEIAGSGGHFYGGCSLSAVIQCADTGCRDLSDTAHWVSFYVAPAECHATLRSDEGCDSAFRLGARLCQSSESGLTWKTSMPAPPLPVI